MTTGLQGDVVDLFDEGSDSTTYLTGGVESTDIGRDSITGLPGDLVQNGVTPWPPWRLDPTTAFMDDAHSQGVFKDIVCPNQAYPTTDPRPA